MDKEIIYKFFRGESTEEQTNELNEWLAENPTHQQQFEQAHEVYEGLLLASAHQRFAERQRFLSWRRIGQVAAGIAAAVMLVAGSYHFTVSHFLHKWSQQTTAIAVPVGQRIAIELEDGTKVWLNAGTRFEYPPIFVGSERRVKVQGEAMFDVEHDAKRPFIVETFACDIRVLGTKFNVEADEQNGLFSTALIRGSVQLFDKHTHETLTLTPDQKAIRLGGHLICEKISNPDAYLWPEGIISLTDSSFSELMARFEKAYGVRIVVQRAGLPAMDLNWGKLRVSSGIDHALRILQHATDFTYVKDEENNVIYIQ